MKPSRKTAAQTLVLFAMLLVVILLFIGLGIDAGFGYLTKARLAKAVDAAAITGIRNLSQGQSTAEDLARKAFAANYAGSHIDVSTPSPTVAFGADANNNLILDVSAQTQIKTFFVKIAGFNTLSVGANAQALRTKLIISLVLDRSGSMVGNGGSGQMPGAVGSFLDHFDDTYDRFSMNSFAYHARTDVTMRQPFKAAINSAVSTLNFNGWTCSEQGLVKGREQVNGVTVQPGEAVSKVIVFFTDGMANTFQYNLDCGARNMSPNQCTRSTPQLWDPLTGQSAGTGCTIPATIPSVMPPFAPVDVRERVQLQQEAEKRAEYIAQLARNEGTYVYCIGLGNPNQTGECGIFPVLNPDFLKRVANDPSSASFDPNQPAGYFALATDATQLKTAFDQIANKILFRLTR